MIKLVAVFAVAVPLIAISGPSFATKGIDAARACDKNPKCTLLLDEKGGATILVGDTVINCPSPQQECSVVRRSPVTKGTTGMGAAGTLSAHR